ncbi:peptidyl-prolyl cis-trans isomerase [Defluviimonas sp. 20V17]|uniref:Parvulin-like PPIase n=2 Tax=Allgaiera indica TaxID=765699 RepID=A0A1H2TUV5_9RHOB|nr:peptidyl-prolyl cis-trans isomerase [Defluviimonas sp. 20V17]SDW47528.1 peptidyl-prolyl cis-trans isomerase C [Allgaiera indica]
MSKQARMWLSATLAAALAAGPALAETAAKPAATADTSASDTKADSKPAETRKVAADTVVASVNGTDITLGDMIALRSQLPAQYQQLPDEVLFKGILDQLVQQTLLQQSMKGKLTKRDKLALANSERAFVASLALRQAEKAAVTPEALKAAYDAKYAHFTPATEYHAAHILVKSEKLAKEIKAKLEKGADFATLAKKYSTDGSAQNGGDLGWFQPDQMVKPFAEAVEKAKVGTIVGPVKTQFGWHVIKVEGSRPTKKPTLAQETPELSQELAKKAVTERLAKLKDGAKVTEDIKGIDPSVLKNQTLLQ